MTEKTLFDPRTTEMPKCPHCGTTAKNACKWEADKAAGLDYRPRPRHCLISFQIPADQPLPY